MTTGDLLFERIPSLRILPPAAVQRLAAAATERRLRAGATVFRAGEQSVALHFVLAGRVRVIQARERAGASRVVHWEDPGGTLGEVPTFGESPFPVTAIAHTTVHLARIAAADVRRLTAEEPALAAFFLRRLARRAAGLLDQLERLRGATVTVRLARHILDRSLHGPDAEFTLGMSQAALAEELGTVREVLVRSLAALKRSGAIAQLQRGRYRIGDPAVLQALLG
jgi:CRP-like cAMP-binding protein